MAKPEALSQRQLEANRRNAQKSTGPRSAAGKRRVSRNATTHGLFCRDVILPGESKRLFEIVRQSFIRKLRPQDIIELSILDRIVAANWKLRRIQTAEKDIIEQHRAELAEAMINSAPPEMSCETSPAAARRNLSSGSISPSPFNVRRTTCAAY